VRTLATKCCTRSEQILSGFLFIACRHNSKRVTQMLLPVWVIRLNIICLFRSIRLVRSIDQPSWSRGREEFNGVAWYNCSALGVIFVGNLGWSLDWLPIILTNFLPLFLQCL
jgi:hypothetical protein